MPKTWEEVRKIVLVEAYGIPIACDGRCNPPCSFNAATESGLREVVTCVELRQSYDVLIDHYEKGTPLPQGFMDGE